MKTIKKIVITGGPCSGKSTMLNLIENTFTEKGYKVLIVSETATELIRGGISPLGSPGEYVYIPRLFTKPSI